MEAYKTEPSSRRLLHWTFVPYLASEPPTLSSPTTRRISTMASASTFRLQLCTSGWQRSCKRRPLDDARLSVSRPTWNFQRLPSSRTITTRSRSRWLKRTRSRSQQGQFCLCTASPTLKPSARSMARN
ncbi:hypothetical protein SPRG_17857 [Saprolegnia parasitica CBS 223.65]|uniref:Uncharacterized protein n=1 Tax=Saprolegnia parasitica (strain CBS 223.65) TaxID=695850 RepID=A0A067BQR4_SAPPC|nr:hypothetical protein SPRG_17857 [Saprolegnia parasitica CBS 223.65]KDO16646.1 hypothetical protein SPRG_17857 [Saprolegnia parasitica CBS 223.65]|eukprot:XP_012212646.1 hypothetical protein SPRG_17857 [Saprolegnia parasitica CBS 223.65]